MPALSPSFETIPGNDMSGQFAGYRSVVCWGTQTASLAMLPRANEGDQIPNFCFHRTLRLFTDFSGDLEGRTERTTEEREIFTLLA